MEPAFDIVIRNGTVIDGSGSPPREADVAIRAGRIAAIGKVEGSGREEIDARGKIVTPGFIDVHTHYDGQATWENRLVPSSNHGVTTVMAGNCGVGFAPCRPEDHDVLVKLMEGVEDVPEVVMTAGLPWNWTTFPDYLDALDARPLDIDMATQIPHSPLRVFVMGERGANREPPTQEDLAKMTALVADAVRAGAHGVSTSRLLSHRASDGTPIPSLGSPREELLALARGLREAGGGVFQLVPDFMNDAEEEFAVMREIAQEAGRPLSFSLAQSPTAPDAWRKFTAMLEEANAEGIVMRGQVFPRPVGMLFGLDLSFNPLSRKPSWSKLADKSLAERVTALRDPEFRRTILAEEDFEHPLPMMNMLLDQLGRMTPLDKNPEYLPESERMIGQLAAAKGQNLVEYALDRMLENDGETVLYLAAGNYADGNSDAILGLMNHDNTVLGLGDGGAHYGLVCDASFPTTVLTRWVRDAEPSQRLPIEAAIKALTSEPAVAIGTPGRGKLEPGYIADVNVIDHDKLTLHAPTVKYDLPGGGRRLSQQATGYTATIKTGVVTYRDGEHTGALPGGLLRRADIHQRQPAMA